MATLCAQPKGIVATPDATEGCADVDCKRVLCFRQGACRVEPAMQQSAGLAVFFFFGEKNDIKKKLKLPKVTLRNCRVLTRELFVVFGGRCPV